MQKVEPKMEASPNRSARLAARAQQQLFLFTSFPYFVSSSLFHYYLQLFQKAMHRAVGVTSFTSIVRCRLLRVFSTYL
jgi:hypothetical protein